MTRADPIKYGSPMKINILKDDLTQFNGREPAFVTFGETDPGHARGHAARRTPRQIDISLSGSEHILCVGLARLGIPCRYITHTPDNPYGWMLRNVSREQGVDTSFFVWAPKSELMGRYIYELGRTPRRSTAWYQRKYSAASKLGAGMVDWGAAQGRPLIPRLRHDFGLAAHSGYDKNYNLEAFEEAISAKPEAAGLGISTIAAPCGAWKNASK